jgi:hypothetical protein
MLSTSESEAPGPLRSLDASGLRWLTVGHATILGIAMAAACLAVGFGVFVAVGFGAFLGALPRLFLALGALIALAGWVAVQNLGGILAGSATDVGTGPVLVLLALAFWPLAGARSRRAGQQPAAGGTGAVREIAASLAGRFAERAITLTTDLAAVDIDADPVRVSQIVANQLTNAAKFVPPGGTVALTLREEAGDRCWNPGSRGRQPCLVISRSADRGVSPSITSAWPSRSVLCGILAARYRSATFPQPKFSG